MVENGNKLDPVLYRNLECSRVKRSRFCCSAVTYISINIHFYIFYNVGYIYIFTNRWGFIVKLFSLDESGLQFALALARLLCNFYRLDQKEKSQEMIFPKQCLGKIIFVL